MSGAPTFAKGALVLYKGKPAKVVNVTPGSGWLTLRVYDGRAAVPFYLAPSVRPASCTPATVADRDFFPSSLL